MKSAGLRDQEGYLSSHRACNVAATRRLLRAGILPPCLAMRRTHNESARGCRGRREATLKFLDLVQKTLGRIRRPYSNIRHILKNGREVGAISLYMTIRPILDIRQYAPALRSKADHDARLDPRPGAPARSCVLAFGALPSCTPPPGDLHLRGALDRARSSVHDLERRSRSEGQPSRGGDLRLKRVEVKQLCRAGGSAVQCGALVNLTPGNTAWTKIDLGV